MIMNEWILHPILLQPQHNLAALCVVLHKILHQLYTQLSNTTNDRAGSYLTSPHAIYPMIEQPNCNKYKVSKSYLRQATCMDI